MARLNYFQNRPKAEKIDVATYLKRIGLQRKEPSLKYLKELQRAHLIAIPFENLDIHYGSKITLNYQQVFKKVILKKRGGFCYELNGLFYHLLQHLDFDCYVISAEVFNSGTETFGKPYDHMALVVRIGDELWLSDVGFGDGIINPVLIQEQKVQMDYHRYWRIEKDADERFLLRTSQDTTYYKTKYRFSLKEAQLIEFIAMCDYHQTSQDSPFTQQKLITRLTDSGRLTLTDRALKIRDLGKEETVTILNEDEFLSKLYHHFEIGTDSLLPMK